MESREQWRKRRHAYWLALGRFVDNFSMIEAQLFETLKIASGVSDQTAPAIFSGTRVDAAMSFLNRIAESGRLTDVANHHLGMALPQH